jgi:hypothetical protein
LNPQPSDLESDALAVRATGLYSLNAEFRFKKSKLTELIMPPILHFAFFIMNSAYAFVSLCGVCFMHCLQYFFL